MNCSLDIIPTTANWIKSILKECGETCVPYLNLVINLISLGLCQLKIECEDGLKKYVFY